MRVGVIGGGMSGLLTTKYCKEAGLDVKCFEQTNDIGGTWVYSENVGHDKNGLKVHSALYKNLKTNLPNQLMQFTDFKLKSGETSYSTGDEMYKFLNDFAEHFKLKENILLEHLITSVTPIENDKWKVVGKNVVAGQEFEETFDAVFVCNGHFFDPVIPKTAGIENFQGQIMHSHEYRRAELFTGKRVLVIGGGPSGVDVTLQVQTTAERVFFSHHIQGHNVEYLPTVVQKPDIIKVLRNGSIEFKNGTTELVDVIIYCTGYNFKYSFLTPECGIKVESHHITDIYQHIVNINHPTMFFIGIPYEVPIYFMAELQVQFCLKFLLHPEKRPSKAEMLEISVADYENLLANGWRKKDLHQIHVHKQMSSYFKFLCDFAEIPRVKPVYEKLARISYDRILNDPVNLRRYKHEIINDEEFVEKIVY